MAENMDPRVWSNVPDHILDHILTFLPFWSIRRLHSVSRKWRSNLTSTNFLAHCGKKSPREVMFVMFTGCWDLDAAAAYNPSLNKWHLIPMSHFNSHPKTFYGFNIVATADGLLCTEVALPVHSLIVVNPVNRSFKKLPPMLHMKSPCVVGMVVDKHKAGYKVLVAQDSEVLISQCYDSKKDSWKMNLNSDMRVAILPGMVSVGDFFLGLSSWPIGVIAYNIEKGTWCDMKVEMPVSVSSPHLIHHNMQLFLVGGVEECGQVTSIRIWKLDLSCKRCEEIERMPDDLFQDFNRVSAELFYCREEAGFVCFSNGITPPVLMYDMDEKRWSWLPPCPLQFFAPKSLGKYALNSLNPIGFPIKLWSTLEA